MSITNSVMVGSAVNVRVRFSKRDTNTVMNPTLATLRVKRGDGDIVDYVAPDVVHDGTGLYHMDVTLDVAGTWLFEWIGTGTVIASSDVKQITVIPGIPAPV